jgi:hypothetical protein
LLQGELEEVAGAFWVKRDDCARRRNGDLVVYKNEESSRKVTRQKKVFHRRLDTLVVESLAVDWLRKRRSSSGRLFG